MNTHLNKQALQAQLLTLQQLYQRTTPSDYKTRIKRLNKLSTILQTYTQDLAVAISEDFTHRSIEETKLLDIVPALSAIDYIKANLRNWMRADRRKIPWYFQPALARVEYQPLGAVGIVVPFNYPLQLLFTPLAYALAAGNVCMINISEHMPAFSQCVGRYLHEAFDDGDVQVINGDLDTAKIFVDLPFDHLFFTGSTAVAKTVLHNTAENLVPTTLELGGKSSAMITANYPLKSAANKILYSKLVNAGQTCIATDHVILAEQQLNEFIHLAKQYTCGFYPDFWNNPHYSHIISAAHYQRLQDLLDDARDKGAHLIPLVADKPKQQKDQRFPPCLLTNVTDAMRIMQEEIFGPILPVITYTDWQEGLQMVKRWSSAPLIIYYFDHDKKRSQTFVDKTRSGNISINSTLIQMAVDDLPFGGIGASGMGRYHGKEGFLCFSNQRSVFKQRRFNTVKLFMPPYKRFTMRLLKFLFGITD